MSMGLSLGLSLSGPRVGTSTPVAGASPTTFAIAPTVQYHPNSQNATLNGSNQVLDCADLLGLAGVVGVAAIGANTIKNPKMVGVVAGTPGTLPTNWSIGGAAGLTTSVIGTGTEKGMAYVDIRLNGTTSGTFTTILMEAASVIAACQCAGMVWQCDAFGGRRLSDQYFLHRAHDQRSRCRCSSPSADQHNRCRYRHGDPFHQLRHDCQRQHSLCAPADRRQLFQWCCHRRNAAHCLSRAGAGRSRHHSGHHRPGADDRCAGAQVLAVHRLVRPYHRQRPERAQHAADDGVCVWRCAKVRMGTDWALLSLRYSAYTDETTNTSQTNGYILRGNAATSTNEVARLKSGTVDNFTATNGGRFIPGAQMHVVGFNSRITANGGGRFYINQDAGDVAQTSLTATGGTGMIIGVRQQRPTLSPELPTTASISMSWQCGRVSTLTASQTLLLLRCRQIGVFPTSTGSTSSTVTVLRNRWRATRQPSIRNLVLRTGRSSRCRAAQ